MILRPYQEEMVVTAMASLAEAPECLIQAATGAGKTIVFAELISRWLREYPTMRILVLVHREILVTQNADKLRAAWPGAPIGIACATASARVDVSARVVFGSIQTLAARLEILPMFHLLIVDEAHRLPPKNVESQYRAVIDRLREYYPALRLFGLTATPYRLNWGPIYGAKHKRSNNDEGIKNWFPRLDLEVGIPTLQGIQPGPEDPDAPYLCPMRAFAEDRRIEAELGSIKTVAGEYHQGQLSDLMRKTIHIQTALDAYRAHSSGRQRCVIFGVDIDHAEALWKVFDGAGIGADIVHSRKEKEHNRDVLRRFDAGELPVVVNVGVMTEGWDCRGVDLILLCRPTKSAALFVQIVGRGLRTWPGKADVIVLDLGNNFNRHGPPWAPILPSYDNPGKPREPRVQAERICPECGYENPHGTWCCENCGTILRVKQVEEAQSVRLRELKWGGDKKDVGEKFALDKMEFFRHSAASGSECLLVLATVRKEGKNMPTKISHYFRLDGPGAYFFGHFWRKVAPGLSPPASIDAAISARKAIAELPEFVRVRKDGKYLKVEGW